MPQEGRPSLYTEAVTSEIIRKLNSGYTLRQIAQHDGMPSERTILRWVERYPEFCQAYTQARITRSWLWADEIIDIADDSVNDWVTRERRNGSTYEAVDREAIERARLRIESRKWLISRYLSHVFGDKLGHEGGDTPVQHVIEGGWMRVYVPWTRLCYVRSKFSATQCWCHMRAPASSAISRNIG
jgi:hypothetical protein